MASFMLTHLLVGHNGTPLLPPHKLHLNIKYTTLSLTMIIKQPLGKGMGTKALDLLCSYASEVLGMHQLAAQIACDNEASRRLFDRCGFKPCGMLRSWLRRGRHYADAIIVQRLFSRLSFSLAQALIIA